MSIKATGIEIIGLNDMPRKEINPDESGSDPLQSAVIKAHDYSELTLKLSAKIPQR